jgi:hypothetical protein
MLSDLDPRNHDRKTEADRNASQVASPRAPPQPECNDADKKQDRRHCRDVERENLDDQGGPYVGAQHDRQGRDQINQATASKRRNHQGRRGTALEKRV